MIVNGSQSSTKSTVALARRVSVLAISNLKLGLKLSSDELHDYAYLYSEHPLPVCFKLFKSNRLIMGNNHPKVLIVYKIFAIQLKSLMIIS